MKRQKDQNFTSAREKFLGLSLESTRKSYYPQLREQLDSSLENESKLRLLLDNLPARIAFVDRDQRYLLVNRSYEKIYGQRREQFLGQEIRAVVGEENYARVKEYIHQALAGKNVRFEVVFSNPDGSSRWLDMSYIPYSPKTNLVEGFYIMSLDISEKKKVESEREELERQLLEVQKNQALGTLAGGIAHDFNNLMMGIQGRASLLEMEYSHLESLMEHVQAIEEYISSASQLTHQLLGFARGGKYQPKPLDICRLLKESATMFGRTHKEISMKLYGLGQSIAVEGDRTQLEQVFLNMFVNSLQAMDGAGTIMIEVTTELLDTLACSAHKLAPGKYVKIVITDDGAGMSDENRQRVFDPFFTTKEKQRGTGLGLASAYGIIKNHAGIIAVESQLGTGSSFTVYLSVSTALVPVDIEQQVQTVPGSARILIVDDEKMVVEVSCRMLEHLGYEVITAGNGEDAIDIVRTSAEEIDLVVLDLIMPGLDGGKVFSELRRLKPGIPILLASGYSLDSQAKSIMEQGCNGFIQKPFGIGSLSQAINQILQA